MSRAFMWGVAVAALLLAATPSSAAPLLGTQVTGSLNFGLNPANYYDPAEGFVPAGCLNTVQGTTASIADPGTEFCFFDGENRDTADFTDNRITITDEVFLSALNWTQVFTNAAFAGLTFVEISDSFGAGGVNLVQLGNQLTFTWAGTIGSGIFTAVYEARQLAAVPEPATLSLLGVGLVAWRVRARRRVAPA